MLVLLGLGGCQAGVGGGGVCMWVGVGAGGLSWVGVVPIWGVGQRQPTTCLARVNQAGGVPR